MRAKEFGTNPKRPARAGSRPERGHAPQPRYTPKQDDGEEWYDKHGNPSPHGAYDAGGHYYLDRDLEETARMSAAVKLQRAFDRERAKSDASRRRGEEVMAQAKKDAEKKSKEQGVAEDDSQGNIDDVELKNIDPQDHSGSEGDFTKNQIHTMLRVLTHLEHTIGDNENLPEWVQMALSQAQDKIVTVMDFMVSDKEREVERQSGSEILMREEGKASRKLCTSSKSDDELGASQLASCKSQGLRARDGNKSHKLGKSPKSRVKVGGHKIRGAKYGGPLPDWS